MQLVQYAKGGVQVGQVGAADLDGGGAGQQVGGGIASGHHAAHSDDGNIYGLRRFVHQGHGDGSEGRAGKPAVARTQHGPPGIKVNMQRRDGIADGQGVGAGGDGGVGNFGDVRHIGR